MTLDEYKKNILNEIKGATSESDSRQAIKKAHHTLDENNISSGEQRQFWSELSEEVEFLGFVHN